MAKLEIERKYLIEIPNIKKLADEFDLIEWTLIKHIVTSEESGVERRVRRTKVGVKHITIS